MKPSNLARCFTLMILLSGCSAMPPPTSQYVRTAPSFPDEYPGIARIGVFADAVLTYDRAGNRDAISLVDSRTAAGAIAAEAKAWIAKGGYSVSFSSVPSIGGFLDSTPLLVSDSRRGDRVERIPPLVIDEDLAGDERYRQAVVRLLQAVGGSLSNSGELPYELFRESPDVAEAARVVGDEKKLSHLLVVVARGVMVSGGKKFGQDLASGLVSGILTLGYASVMRHNISFIDSWVALIDLRRGEMLWSNSLRMQDGDPSREKYYAGRWGRNLLFHFPAMSARPPATNPQEP